MHQENQGSNHILDQSVLGGEGCHQQALETKGLVHGASQDTWPVA
jgi:hypothetical protein